MELVRCRLTKKNATTIKWTALIRSTYFLYEKCGMLWIIFTCLVMFPWVLHKYVQNGQEKGFALVCITVWRNKWCFVWKVLWHWEQGNFLGSCTDLRCTVSLARHANELSHCSHLKQPINQHYIQMNLTKNLSHRYTNSTATIRRYSKIYALTCV